MTYEDGIKVLNRHRVSEKLGSQETSLNSLVSNADIKTLACENRDFANSLRDYLTERYNTIEFMRKLGDIYINNENEDEVSLLTTEDEKPAVYSYVVLSQPRFSEESLNTRFLTQISHKMILNCQGLSNVSLNEYMHGNTIPVGIDSIDIRGYINPNDNVVITDFISSDMQKLSFYFISYSHIRSLRAEDLRSFAFTTDNVPIVIAMDSFINSTSVKEVYLSFTPVLSVSKCHPILVPMRYYDLEIFGSTSMRSNGDYCYIVDKPFDMFIREIKNKFTITEFCKGDCSYLMYKRSVMAFDNVTMSEEDATVDCLHISGVDLSDELMWVYLLYFGVSVSTGERDENNRSIYKYHKVRIEYSDTDTPNLWDKLINLMEQYDGKYIMFEVKEY